MKLSFTVTPHQSAKLTASPQGEAFKITIKKEDIS